MFDIEAKLTKLMATVEGGYTNDPDDPGGETNHGITVFTARAYGYTGPMPDLPVAVAREIFRKRYWTGPRFADVLPLSARIAGELFDTGVNMGQGVATTFLQRALNVLNLQEKTYPDIRVDGAVGAITLHCLQSFLDLRGQPGEDVLYTMMNSQQAVRYIELAEKNASQEKYEFGWQLQRVVGEL